MGTIKMTGVSRLGELKNYAAMVALLMGVATANAQTGKE